MLHLASRSWPWVLLRGILAVVFGLVALFLPGAAIVALGVIFGLWLLLDGILSFVNAFAASAASAGDRILLGVLGGVGVVAGVIALVRPATALVALAWIVAAWLIVAGIAQIAVAARIRREASGEGVLVVVGVLAILAGIVALVLPGIALTTLTLVLGIVAVVLGIVLVVAALRLRGVVKAAERAAR